MPVSLVCVYGGKRMATKLYENIKFLCDEQNTNIKKLEREAGVPINTVVNWKEERRWMIYLPLIAKELNVPIGSLFDGDLQKRKQGLDRLISALWELSLDDKAIDTIIEIASSIAAHYPAEAGIPHTSLTSRTQL